MSPAAVETLEREVTPTVGDRVADAVRHASHLSHEARLLSSMAADAVEDRVYAAKRAVKSVERRVEDLKEEAVHGIKRRPLGAVSGAFGIGLGLGLVAACMAYRFGRRA